MSKKERAAIANKAATASFGFAKESDALDRIKEKSQAWLLENR
jgi:hypothetical protein